MKNIEVVILANSVKHQQHCVAGKCIANGQWVRPVSNADGAELSHAQALCKNPYGQFNVKPLQKVIMWEKGDRFIFRAGTSSGLPATQFLKNKSVFLIGVACALRRR